MLTYVSATAPMVIGSLNATPIGNKVYYSRTQNVQSIKNTTYHHVIFDGGSTRTLLGDMTVNGDLTIGAETILYTSDFQITGNATGLLTMGESSELRIGRTNVQSAAVFPTGFVRANMVFDPISLVTYNGVAQLLSHEPVYSNLAITSGGNKTITGDVTVNGYLNITTGNLVYGSTVAQNVTINGDLYASGGTFNMSGGGLAHVLDLYGGINQVNRFTAALNSRVRYMSTDAQQVFSPTSGDYYGKFEVQGGSVKFLELDTEIRGELIMTSGIIRLGDKNLTLNTNSAAVLPITGACSSSNMIETNGLGKLIRKGIGASPYNYLLGLYPIGSEGKYSPVTLTSIAGGSSNRSFQVRALAERHPNVPATYDALLRYYDIVTDVTTPTAVANFAFDALDVIGDVAKYKAYSWNGTSFVNPATSSIVGTSIVFSPATSVPLQVTAYDNVTVRRTLYAYKDGPWDDPDTWTTDPSGQNLEGASVPVSSDNVVILPSRTIHLLNNVTVSGLIITINGGGILDLRDKGFTQTVSIIQGEGTMRMASNQMPPASLNSLVKAGGGTVEYNVADASFILNSQAVYNNLTINLTNASNKAILMNNLTVHGNLLIDKGNLQLYKDDATATVYNPIILDVKKDLVVSVNGKITTGTASTTLGNLPPSGTTPGSLVTRYYDA